MTNVTNPETNDSPRQAARRWPLMKLIRIAVLIAAIAYSASFIRVFTLNAELEWFKTTYGPSRNSEHAEEWLIRDYFRDQRDGLFVDVGASDYKRFSNTYYLEHALGWSGLAIDAQEEFAADYKTFRPHTRFFSFFISDRSDAVELLFVPDGNRLVASSSKEFSDRYDASGKAREVRTITLNDLLDRERITRIDFLTMDIELAEPKALAGFDIARFRPRLVCVEAHPEIRQQLIDYFTDRRYRLVARYLRADLHNLWFAPADLTLPDGVPTADPH